MYLKCQLFWCLKMQPIAYFHLKMDSLVPKISLSYGKIFFWHFFIWIVLGLATFGRVLHCNLNFLKKKSVFTFAIFLLFWILIIILITIITISVVSIYIRPLLYEILINKINLFSKAVWVCLFIIFFICPNHWMYR